MQEKIITEEMLAMGMEMGRGRWRWLYADVAFGYTHKSMRINLCLIFL